MPDVIWRVNTDTYLVAVEILGELLEEEEWTERYYCLLDQIKSLPGYPLTANEETDRIIVEEVRAPQTGARGQN